MYGTTKPAFHESLKVRLLDETQNVIYIRHLVPMLMLTKRESTYQGFNPVTASMAAFIKPAVTVPEHLEDLKLYGKTYTRFYIKLKWNKLFNGWQAVTDHPRSVEAGFLRSVYYFGETMSDFSKKPERTLSKMIRIPKSVNLEDPAIQEMLDNINAVIALARRQKNTDNSELLT